MSSKCILLSLLLLTKGDRRRSVYRHRATHFYLVVEKLIENVLWFWSLFLKKINPFKHLFGKLKEQQKSK
jgi:hypothetical protein